MENGNGNGNENRNKSKSTKEILRSIAETVGKIVAMACILLVLLPFNIFGMLGGIPIYWVWGVNGAVIVLVVFAIIKIICARWVQGQKAIKYLRIAALVCCAIYVGHGIYVDNIPTVDDRSLMLNEYEPFEQSTKAVSLSEESSLHLEEPLPSLDGATALYPIYAAFVQAAYPEETYRQSKEVGRQEKYFDLVNCTGTGNAYERLINGEVDVIFVAGPSEYQKILAQEAGVELHMTPIGREAFVFFVNNRNPVEGLSLEEIQGIYSGKITNWSEVGGKNQKIRAFQRPENSGSQTALQNVMGKIPLTEPPSEEVISAMDGIINTVSNYKNYNNAIGFSFRFYSTEMVVGNQIRLLSVNGVLPEKETIRDGSYPISSEFYAITTTEDNQQINRLIEWILSPQGQELVEKTGYVPVQ